MKKISIGVILILLCTIFLYACGTDGENETADAQSVKTITVWAWDPTYNIKALEIAASYSDIELNIVEVEQTDVIEKLNAGFASESMSGMPDLVLIGDYYVEQLLAAYPDGFESLGDIVDKEDFVESKINLLEKNGEIYGVPFESGVAGLFYRVDYLKEAGYDPKDMENITWDEYIEIGKQIKEKTGKAMLCVDPNGQRLLRMMMISAGVWYTSSSSDEVTIENNEALIEGIKVITRMVEEGITVEKSGWYAGVEAVNSGEVASELRGSWYSSSIMNEASQSGKWRIAPFPRFSNVPSVNASDLGGSNWFVLKDTEGSELAKQFLKDTFASNEKLLAELTENIGLVSTMKSVLDTEVYQQSVAFYDNQTVYKNFLEWMQEIPDTYYGKRTYEIEDMITPYITRAIKGEPVESLMKEAQRQVEASVSES